MDAVPDEPKMRHRVSKYRKTPVHKCDFMNRCTYHLDDPCLPAARVKLSSGPSFPSAVADCQSFHHPSESMSSFSSIPRED